VLDPTCNVSEMAHSVGTYSAHNRKRELRRNQWIDLDDDY